MKTRPRLLAGVAAAAVLAAGAPALATQVIETTRYYVVPSTETTTYYTITDPTPTYYYVAPAPGVSEVIYEAPAITIEGSRLTEDQRITDDVVGVLANDPYLSGRIGVETRNQDVNLTGSVTTPGQVRRAVRDAKSVWGVGNVTSELRPKVGANTSY